VIVISSSFVLSATPGTDGRNPRICWQNLITANSVSADSATADEPIANIANPATYLAWRSASTSAQNITCVMETAADVDYFALARHNLGSTGATVQLQYSTDGGSTWQDASDAISPVDDTVLVVLFESVFAARFRLHIVPGDSAPSIAVMYLGAALVLQRRIYVGHAPFPYARNSTVSTGRSESGQFMGRTKRREWFENAVDLQNITPGWFRENMTDFLEASVEKPFFFAWRPSQYPLEVGYCWLKDDAKVSNAKANGMMHVSLALQGLR
jgi:hypothetical protein